MSTGERVSIVPEAAEGEPPLRGQWIAPFIISPHNPRIIYHGMNFLYRSMNRGENFEKISPDLTYNELDRIGDIPYQTIYTISESPFRFGLIYVGTDDGRVWMTPDGGETWNELTGNLPPRKFISRIVASAFDAGTVYMPQTTSFCCCATWTWARVVTARAPGLLRVRSGRIFRAKRSASSGRASRASRSSSRPR